MKQVHSTPWGAATTAHQIAPGITDYSTPSHGGFGLSVERIAQMPAALRAIAPFAGPGWYEEDQDWALVAVSFPAECGQRSLMQAIRSLLGERDDSYLAPARAWLATPEAAPLMASYGLWLEAQRHNYAPVASGSVPRRYEQRATELQRKLREQHADPMLFVHWVSMRRMGDNAPAEALLLDDEMRDGTIDLRAIPAERVLVQPAA